MFVDCSTVSSELCFLLEALPPNVKLVVHYLEDFITSEERDQIRKTARDEGRSRVVEVKFVPFNSILREYTNYYDLYLNFSGLFRHVSLSIYNEENMYLKEFGIDLRILYIRIE